jgi:hypothetical protein
MKYGKYWFHLKKYIANFHNLGLLIPKKRVKSEKVSVCHAALPWVFGQNLRRSKFCSYESFLKMQDGSKFGKRCISRNLHSKLFSKFKENLEFFLLKGQKYD